MTETFADILTTGKPNSLGRADEVVEMVVADKSRLEELYLCLFEDDAWLRMRAIDSLEKVCRDYPEWLAPYVDRMFEELGDTTQPSIQWHMAQMFTQIDLTEHQRELAITWLTSKLSTVDTDWIVAANCMSSLALYVDKGWFEKTKLIPMLERQQSHHSNAVVRRATKILDTLK